MIKTLIQQLTSNKTRKKHNRIPIAKKQQIIIIIKKMM